ncbi:MAG: DUF2721 domain-containing protein [Sphingomonadales bacterium]|jgi:hypothetical protein
MALFGATDAVAGAIQLAVAPVFLLTATGAMLNVMVTRLGRVVDRARHLEEHINQYNEPRRLLAMGDLAVLDRRIVAANWAVALSTSAALLVCVVVALLFFEEQTGLPLGTMIAWLFVAATVLLTGGLLLFLWEVQLALRSVRVRAAAINREG